MPFINVYCVLDVKTTPHCVGFQFVTCGTVLKLSHIDTNIRLHSHDVKYGSGSGQQVSVSWYISHVVLCDVHTVGDWCNTSRRCQQLLGGEGTA